MVNRADLGELSVSRYSDDDLRRIAETCGRMDLDLSFLRTELDRVLNRYQIAAGIDRIPTTRQIKKALRDINAAATKLCKKLDDLAPPLRIVVLDRLTLAANAEAVSRGICDVVQVYGGEHIEVAGGDFLLNEAVRSVRLLQELSAAVSDGANAVPKVEAAASTREVSEPSAYELLIGKYLRDLYEKLSRRKAFPSSIKKYDFQRR